MKLALGFNPVISARDAAGVAVRAEAAGYDSVWMHESLFQRDVVSYLASMALSTKSIRLGSGIINTYTRHPVIAATTFATLSELSGGRTTMGVGLGSFPTMPLIGHRIFPVEKSKPLKRIREFLAVVRAVWGGGKVDFDGEFFTVHNLELGLKMEHKVPIFVGSLSPKTQKYAATVADGVILSPSLNTAKGTAAMVANVKAGEEASGRRVERASYMLTSVDEHSGRAQLAVKDFYFFVYQLAEVVKPEVLEPYGVTPEKLAPLKEAWKKGDQAEARKLVPDEAVEALTVTGTPDHAMDRVKEYQSAGVTLPILMPIGNIPYAMESLAPGGK